MIFRDIDMESRELLNPYFDLVDYEACEYCFNTLYMWQHLYKTGYYIGDGFAVIVAEGKLVRNNRVKKPVPHPISKIEDIGWSEYTDNNRHNSVAI